MQHTIALLPVAPADLPVFRRRLQEAFTHAVREAFPDFTEIIPPDRDIDESLAAQNAQAFDFLCKESFGDTPVGGAIVSGTNERMLLDFIFIDTVYQNQHFGLAAWQAIEAAYPQARIWELVTPYHEKRNVHFYVNKCGFSIVEYYNDRHPDPHYPQEEAGDYPGEDDGLFRFEKIVHREPCAL